MNIRNQSLMYVAIIPYTVALLGGVHAAQAPVPPPSPPAQNLTERTQEAIETNLSKELADLLDANHEHFQTYRQIRYDLSKPIGERVIYNTSHGSLSYRRSVKTQEILDYEVRYREDIRTGRVISSAHPDLSIPLTPVGTIDESTSLEKHGGETHGGETISVDITTIGGNKSLEAFTRRRGEPYQDRPDLFQSFTDIYTDHDLDGNFNTALNSGYHNGIPFHGYNRTDFVDVGTMTEGEVRQRQPRFESMLMEVSAAVRDYLSRTYRVVLGDSLTHIVKRQAVIRNERLAYLEALRQAVLNDIPNPNHIVPGQRIVIYPVPNQ